MLPTKEILALRWEKHAWPSGVGTGDVISHCSRKRWNMGCGSSCETSELWSCWRAQVLLKGTLFCCRDGKGASVILPRHHPKLLRLSVDHHSPMPSTGLQAGQRLSLTDCIHFQVYLGQQLFPTPVGEAVSQTCNTFRFFCHFLYSILGYPYLLNDLLNTCIR